MLKLKFFVNAFLLFINFLKVSSAFELKLVI